MRYPIFYCAAMVFALLVTACAKQHENLSMDLSDPRMARFHSMYEVEREVHAFTALPRQGQVELLIINKRPTDYKGADALISIFKPTQRSLSFYRNNGQYVLWVEVERYKAPATALKDQGLASTRMTVSYDYLQKRGDFLLWQWNGSASTHRKLTEAEALQVLKQWGYINE